MRASRISAKAGARVAIAEESRVGGTCVIRGCIPKKLLVYARYLPFSRKVPSSSRSIVSDLNYRFSHFSGDFEDSRNFGWSVDVKGFDWKKLIDNKDKEIDRLNGIYKNLLAGSGVKLIEGRATLVDAHTVKVRRCNVYHRRTMNVFFVTTAAKTLNHRWAMLPTRRRTSSSLWARGRGCPPSPALSMYVYL